MWLANNNATIQRTQYYPSGLPWAEGTGAEVQQKKYNGKEWIEAHGLDEYDSQARMYYPAIMRTTTIDPLAEKYYHISPYAWCGNNPVSRMDPDGRDWYFFNKSTGEFDRKEEQNGSHRMVIHSLEKTKEGYEYDSYSFVDFADPLGDAKDIDDGIITQYRPVPEIEIQSMLEGQGAFNDRSISLGFQTVVGGISFGLSSLGGKKYDYTYSVLEKQYPEARFNRQTGKSNTLFLPEDNYVVHNFMNFGNYLWGATGYSLGFDFADLQVGAHINSLINPRRNGYPPQWDSKDDQRSVILGAYHAKVMNYRKKRK